MRTRLKMNSSSKAAPLLLEVTIDELSIRKSTGYTIDPSQFDSKGQRLKNMSSNQVDEVMNSVTEMTYNFRKAYNALISQEMPINKINLVHQYDRLTRSNGQQEENKVNEFSIKYQMEQMMSIRKQKISPARQRHHLSAYNVLLQFAKEKGIDLDFDRFTSKHYDDFMYWLQTDYKSDGKGRELTSFSTLASYEKLVNSWIRFAHSRNIPTLVQPRVEYKITKKIKPTLSFQELEVLRDHETFSSGYQRTMKALPNWRKLALILAVTGVRISDLPKVLDQRYHRIIDGELYVQFVDNKTGRITTIPIMPCISFMIKHRPPKLMAEQVLRKGLKKLMIAVYGADYEVNAGGHILNLADHISPHALRATYATNLYKLRTINPMLIEQSMSHAIKYSSSAAESYINDHSELMAQDLRKELAKIQFYMHQIGC